MLNPYLRRVNMTILTETETTTKIDETINCNNVKELTTRQKYHKKWYEKNKEKKLRQCAEYERKNKDTIRKKHQIWYQKNKDKVLAQQKEYYEKKKKDTPVKEKVTLTEEQLLEKQEKQKQYQKEYYKKNQERKKQNIKENYKKKSEEIKAYNRHYRKEHADEIRERQRVYRHAHREKIRIYHKKRYKNMLIRNDNTITPDVVIALFSQAEECPYCGKEMLDNGGSLIDIKTIDHLVPIAKGGWHSKYNVVVCCHHCNSRKTNLDYFEWVNRLEEPYKTNAKIIYMKTHMVDNIAKMYKTHNK